MSPAPVAWRPVPECSSCRYFAADSGPALCTWHPHIDAAYDWPAMVQRIEIARAARGLCGIFGKFWRACDEQL